MGWWLKEVKQPHLDSLIGFLSKLEPSLSLGSYLCWKSGHSQAGAGRKRQIVSDLKRVCSGCRTTAVEEVGWLQGHWTWQESLFSSLHRWKSGVTLEPLEQSWGSLEGSHSGEAHCPLQLRSQQPSWDHSSPPATSLCFTKRQKCALGKGVLVTLFLLPAWKRREAPCLLSSGSRALPQHFIKCYRPFPPCYCVCFAERDVEAAK